MEFEEKKKNGTLDTIIILAGLAFLYLIIKSNQSQQQQKQIQFQQYSEPVSRYENAENWEVLRGEDGFISNVKAMRDATVGNTMVQQRLNSANSSSIDIDSYIDNRVRQMMQKNMQDMTQFNQRFGRLGDIKINDEARKRRFGFS